MQRQVIVDGAKESRVAEQRPEEIVGISFLMRSDPFLQIVKTGHSVEAGACIGCLELLAELVLADTDEYIADRIAGRVDVDEVVGLEVAVCGDRFSA